MNKFFPRKFPFYFCLGTLREKYYDPPYIDTVYCPIFSEPLPEGIHYREVHVRFGYPGAFVDYRFIQEDNTEGIEEVADYVDAVPIAYYDISGRQYSEVKPGVNIVKMSNGAVFISKTLQKCNIPETKHNFPLFYCVRWLCADYFSRSQREATFWRMAWMLPAVMAPMMMRPTRMAMPTPAPLMPKAWIMSI